MGSVGPNEVPREDAEMEDQQQMSNLFYSLRRNSLHWSSVKAQSRTPEGNNVEHWDFQGAGLCTDTAELMARFSRTAGCDL